MEIDKIHTHTHHARTNNNITQKHVTVLTTCSIHFNRNIFSIEMILIHGKNGGLHVVYVK